MVKDIITRNRIKILISILISSLLFNVFQYKTKNDLQTNFEICKKNSLINNSIIDGLESDKQELEDEKEELENELEECKNHKIFNF